MDRSRRSVLLTIVVVVALFFIADPFNLLPSPGMVRRPSVSTSLLEDTRAYIREVHEDPVSYVTSLFDRHDLVFIGEFGRIREHVTFIQELIPALHDAGIRHLGLQHAIFDDQERIDELLSSDSYDEELVESFLFNRLVIWGFQEYADIFRAAWEVNRNLGPGEEPFRIIGLNIGQDYAPIQTEEDMEDQSKLRLVLEPGIPDEVMAQNVFSEIVDPGHRAVIFTEIEHSFTGFENLEYRDRMAELGYTDARRLGNIVYDRIGERAVNVYLHGPWPDSESPTQIGYAADGLIDAAIRVLPPEMREGGFDITSGVLSEVPIRSGSYTYEREDLTLGELADGYVYFGQVTELSPVTAIDGFFDEDNIDEAIANFPGPKPEDVGAEELNDYLRSIPTNLSRALEEFN
jgi:hypothetical protein